MGAAGSGSIDTPEGRGNVSADVSGAGVTKGDKYLELRRRKRLMSRMEYRRRCARPQTRQEGGILGEEGSNHSSDDESGNVSARASLLLTAWSGDG